jgi:aminoglycoside phosphotransferase (APT) family kinase protein
MTPLPGGHSSETFVADAAGDRTVVRVYAERGARRGVEAPSIDAAVLRLVRGLLPVPEVLEVRRPRDDRPGVLVTSLLPGRRLDLVLPRLDDRRSTVVGRNLGVLLARLAMMPMPRTGLFVDADLRIEPFGFDLPAFVESQRAATALAGWPAREYDELLAVAVRAQELLDGIGRSCLAHSDLNPKNLLVDPDTLQVTGLVDWEFAHAGLPGTDLGNLLRFDRARPFAEVVLDTYREHVVDAPDAVPDLLDQARAADLFALVDLAARRGENPVTEQAHGLLLAIARTGDLHGVPPAH